GLWRHQGPRPARAGPTGWPGTAARPGALGPLEGRPGHEEALLAHSREADDGLGLVALADDLEDDAFAPLPVHHVLAHREGQVLGPGGAGGRSPAPAQGRLHHRVPPPADGGRPPGPTPAFAL